MEITFFGLPKNIEEELDCLDYERIMYNPPAPIVDRDTYNYVKFKFSEFENQKVAFFFPIVVYAILDGFKGKLGSGHK